MWKFFIIIYFLLSNKNIENLVIPAFQNYATRLSSNFYGLCDYRACSIRKSWILSIFELLQDLRFLINMP